MPKWLVRGGQLVLLIVVAVFVWRAVSKHWDQLRATGLPALDIRPLWVISSALTVWCTYFLLILAWRFVLAGWDQKLPIKPAVRIWCLSNLGRYVPGKVWTVAGMAVLAKAQGVDAWAATASALVLQVIALTTGAVVILATAPTLSGMENGLSLPALIVAGALGITGVSLLTVPEVMKLLGRLTNGRFEPKPLSIQAVAAGTASTLLSWLAYGLALWMLARGVIPATTLAIPVAVGSFAAAYVMGLIMIFAPGGLGVREGVMFGLLTPIVGAGAAVVLVPASRLLLTVTEVSAAAAAAALMRDE